MNSFAFHVGGMKKQVHKKTKIRQHLSSIYVGLFIYTFPISPNLLTPFQPKKVHCFENKCTIKYINNPRGFNLNVSSMVALFI